MLLIEKTIKSPTTCVLVGLFALLLLSLSCSKSTDPDPNKPPDTGPVGILLSGTDGNPALSGTSNHGPFAVPASEWDGDFVTTRLEAVINPSATVGAVNTALNSVSAKISCMRAGMMFIELVVPAQASEAQANVICSTLMASNAFLSAYPCFDPINGNDGAVIPDFPANMRITPLEEAKFPAAWNLRERAAGLHSPVTIVVSDDFASFAPHPEIPAQTFIPGIGTVLTSLNGQGIIDGNHGFAVAGTIGARFDDIGSTGAFPDTANLLRLPCISLTMAGSWFAILTELYTRMPATGKFILNASWGYAGDFTLTSKRRRIEHAFCWRELVALRQNDFLVTQASGNNGFYSTAQTNADYNSPLTLAARFDTPLEMLQGTAVPPADTAALNTIYANIVTKGSIYAAKLRNVVTVGSSDWSGGISTFSNGPADVRMIGENVTLPCAMADGICGPGADVAWQGSYDGTSFATPQVAALAGWLWALSPALTVDETKAIILNCFYNNKWVDAYKAVLSLDHSIANAGIRLSLLDVADAAGQKGSDMLFDEKDLQMFLDSILHYEADRGTHAPPWPRDHSCFDLNGDGYTGDTMLTPSTAPFDLDINTPPAYSQLSFHTCVDTSFNEASVTDRDILYYYSYSSLYTGNQKVRDSLLGCGRNVVARHWQWSATAGAHFDSDYQFESLNGYWPTDTSFSAQPGLTSSPCMEAGYATANTDINGLHTFTGQGRDLSSIVVGGTTTFRIQVDPDTLCRDRLIGTGALSYALDFEVLSRPVNYSLSYSVDAVTGEHTHSDGTFYLEFSGVDEIGQRTIFLKDQQHSTSILIPSNVSVGALQPRYIYHLAFQLSLLGIYDGDASVTVSLQLF